MMSFSDLKPPTLPTIDISKGYFDTANHRYFIQPTPLSIARYKVYKWKTHEVVFNQDVKNTIDRLVYINKLSTGKTEEYNLLSICSSIANESHELVSNLMKLTNLSADNDNVLMLCALFCNRHDENTKIYDEKVMKAKILDWENEGFDIEGFFLLCHLGLRQLKEHYNYISEHNEVMTSPVKKS